jgi:hypothetical protein
MSIQSAKININGTDYTLTYNSTSGKYEATITAPGSTSYNLTNHYYNCSVTATNTAGTSTTVTGDTLSGLRLVVHETVKPVITITSPTSGAYVTNNKQPVVFTVVDESGGSGINIGSLVVKQDGTATTAYTTTAITNGYSVTYTPTTALTDGSHTVTVDISDNDGNAAVQKTTTYTVDTVAPTLNVTNPANNLVTNSASLTVSGTTNDATSSPVSVTIKLNGTDQGSVTVTSGAFSKAITLATGSNTILVTATDAAGRSSTVTRTVTLDTTSPQITAVTITPNPADTGASMVVSVTITG